MAIVAILENHLTQISTILPILGVSYLPWDILEEVWLLFVVAVFWRSAASSLLDAILLIDDTLKNQQEMKDVLELQSSDANTHHTAKTTEHKKDDASGQVPQHLFEGTRNEDASDKVQQNISQFVPDPDSTTSGTISSETREAIDTLIADLGNCLFLLNQLVREKEKEVLEDDILPYFPFEGCGTTNQQLSYLIDEYIQLINKGLLKTHANKDCGLYVATFAKFLSDQLVIPPDGYVSSYLHNRYATLLWRYDNDKAKGGYISVNDDPQKSKGEFTAPSEEDLVNM
ncbi:hypothetical protein MTR67_000907 [Solanum verrucosum]|uniref:Ulp1 protease family, C-terminal catalytic domain containing protein n=1 Tax=Solanum verrucosum TaxID=315347 RepID=A0AAF0T4L0_SOLVR|nr:hypothetical protein MTR67_000907 [Solanum verrucosum]